MCFLRPVQQRVAVQDAVGDVRVALPVIMGTLFDAIDKDKSGTIDKAEWKAVTKVLSHFDSVLGGGAHSEGVSRAATEVHKKAVEHTELADLLFDICDADGCGACLFCARPREAHS